MRDYGSMIGQMELQNKNTKKLIEQLEKKDKQIQDLTEKLLKVMDKYTELQNKIYEAIEYIKDNEKEYGSLQDNEKIILDILELK